MEIREKRYDVVVIGGGMAGLCAAIAAAREGSQTALVHNRAVKGIQQTTETTFLFYGKIFADATGDALIAQQAGADTVIGRENC